MTRAAAAALALLTLLRLVVAASTPLSPDEAYYWTWSEALAPGYLDHPPMVALWIRLGTLLAGDDPLGVRLLSPFSALTGSLLAAAAARDLLGYDRERSWAAAILLNATPMMGVGSVTMTPDTPVLFFWTAVLWCAGRAYAGSSRWLLGAGAGLGLAFESKYTASLLAPALALWLLAFRGWRRTLASPLAWGAAIFALLAAAPVVGWNAAHHFASFTKQGGRTLDIHLRSALRFLLELGGGQLGLASPLIAAMACAGVAQAVRRARRGNAGALLISLATLLPAAVFIVHAAGGDRVQANWPSVIYPSAAIAAAGCQPRRWFRWLPAAVLGFALTALVYLQATLHPLSLPGRSDVTLIRLAGWPGLARAVSSVDPSLPLVADDYALASELAWWGVPTLGLDRRWTFLSLPRVPVGRGAVLLIRDARRTAPDPAIWSAATPVAVLGRGRNGVVAERYVIFRAVAATPETAVRLPIRPRLSPR